jgi:LysM repeat protein
MNPFASVPPRRLRFAVASTLLVLLVIVVDRWRSDESGVQTAPVASVTVAATVTTTRPLSARTTVPTRQPVAYVIKLGEALSDIAARNGLSTRELALFNNIEDPNRVQAGDRIVIPPPSPSTSRPPRPTGPTTTTTLPVATTIPDDGNR